jgi:hypothetical protein
METIDRGAESECSTTSTHPSSLGRPYTPPLPDDSGASDPEAEADPDTIRKASTDLQDARGASGSDNVHQLDTPESSVHRVPMPWTKTTPVTLELDSLASSLASSVVKGSEENAGKATL